MRIKPYSKPGTIISTEPGVRADGVSFVWEDVHVVTETGSEKLTLETPEATRARLVGARGGGEHSVARTRRADRGLVLQTARKLSSVTMVGFG